MLLVVLHLVLLGAVCSFGATAPVCVGRFLLLLAALGPASGLPFWVLGAGSSAGFLSCRVPFRDSRSCLRCYACCHQCLYLLDQDVEQHHCWLHPVCAHTVRDVKVGLGQYLAVTVNFVHVDAWLGPA